MQRRISFLHNAGEDSSRRSCEELLMSTLLLSDLIISLSVNWRPRQLLKISFNGM
ncbi:hypothetical protein ACR782_12990 [Sphingobacterium spiritivorum]|uniref:hypothetical protein n=1 Tax=Sphingobacterium spiritivorum TaxID=258 RepID=UPI003DA5BEFB